MANGYAGKDLVVDLNHREVKEGVISEDSRLKFIGGYGLGAKYLWDSQKAGADPLGPENILGITTGPLTGTQALFGSRFTVVGKSPLTHTWGDANCGGDFGPHLKFSGVDNIYFTGLSDTWVYLFIDNGKGQIRDASHLVGMDTTQTEYALQKELGSDVKIACIGPSGEKLSLISSIITNRGRTAGRSGLGAVMGAKRIKAIAVKGNNEVPVSDKDGLKASRLKYLGGLEGGLYESLKKFGTCGNTASSIRVGDAPVKNWIGTWEDSFPTFEAIFDVQVIDRQKRRFGCWQCPVACGGLMKQSSGKWAYDEDVHKPEYETIIAFGSLCTNNDLESIILANDICNRQGVDTISAGAVIAFATECYENGLITSKDTDGIDLKWGNSEAIIKMLLKLVTRTGFGDILADGVRVAADKIGKGAEQFSIHIQGQELPMHDPKRYISYGPTYWVDPTPARHMQGSEAVCPKGLGLPSFDRKSPAGRGEARRIAGSLAHVVNCAGECLFGYQMLPFEAFREALSLATGWNLSQEELVAAGERILNLRHAFNLREGLKPAQFNVPKRVVGQPPFEKGPLAGRALDLKTMVDDYLSAVKWDKNWAPSVIRLKELGLTQVAEELTRLGIIEDKAFS